MLALKACSSRPKLTLLFVLLSGGSFVTAFGLWLVFDGQLGKASLVYDSSHDLGLVPRNSNFEYAVVFRNQSSSAVRIIGSEYYCTPSACLCPKDIPAVIPPHSTYRLLVTVKGGMSPGSFDTSIQVYTDCAAHGVVELSFHGTIRP